MPDRNAAVAEMRRVLRPGGRVGIGVWLSTARLEPFIHYGDALAAHGVPEPFPGAYDSTPITMTEDEVRQALESVGFAEIDVVIQSLDVAWPDPEWAAAAMSGTPFGPAVASFDPGLAEEVLDDVRSRMTGPRGAALSHRTTSVLARAVAP